MNLIEAEKIIESYETYVDWGCTCFQGIPACAKCENCPSEDIYKEANTLIEIGEESATTLIEELLEQELGDYSFKWKVNKEEIELCDGKYFVYVSYYTNDVDNPNCLTFKISGNKIFINHYEDIYYKIQMYDYSMKYLWIQIRWD